MVEQAAKAPAKAAPAASGGNDDTKLIGALCYVIQFWVPLFVLLTDKKNNKTLLFHAWQSLIFMVVWFVVFIGLSVVLGILTAVTGGAAGILNCLLLPVAGALCIYALFVAYKTYQGEKVMMPVIGEQAQKMANK
ncbi:MAG: DUF4870 domain-containing protein [Candidatus Micrarchaeota archaeon]